jgi:AraC-like DNA-binding protein
LALSQHTVAIHWVDRILQGARKERLDVDALLVKSGISPALLDARLARVSQQQYSALIRTLCRALHDEYWGLTSRPLRVGSFAQGCEILIHCTNLRQVLQRGFHFYRLMIDDFCARLQVRNGVAHVSLSECRSGDARMAFAQVTFLFFCFGLISWLVARRIPLLSVDYRESGPVPGSIASRVFQAPVRYGQARMGFSFEARWLDLPVVQNPQTLREFLRRAPLDLLVRYRDHSSITERIRRLLLRNLDGELPSLEAVGKSLAMTPQTLRRRLREEGKGFQALKDDLRRDAAIEYLARAELSLVDISAHLGFSDPSTFHRAFKKWTGVAPGEYRHAHCKGADPAG